MLNFLPQKNKKQIIFEYLLRISTFLLAYLFIASLILISLFAPSFFFVKYKNNTINNQLESVKQKNQEMGEDPVIFIKNINKLGLALSPGIPSRVTYSDILNKIVSLKNNGIKISAINITQDSNTGNSKIIVNGIANTRDNLTLFDKDIRIDGFFSNVIFPVANFIKSTNSEFSATLTI